MTAADFRLERIKMLTADIGRRIELVSMDSHCHDISIALYQQDHGAGPEYRIHTYSRDPEAPQRVEFIREAMVRLAGLELVQGGSGRIRFPCRGDHAKACKRAFLEVCKLPNGTELAPKALSIFDQKSNRTIRINPGAGDSRQLSADGADDEEKTRRLAAIAQGLAKLAEVQVAGEGANRITFSCGRTHDPLIGLLLGRALNVRAVIREQEEAAGRGVLLAPGAQNQSMDQ